MENDYFLAGFNQPAVGAAATGEVGPTVPGPPQSRAQELEEETLSLSQGNNPPCPPPPCPLFTLNQLSNWPQLGFY